MPNFKKEGRGFKMKGFTPFTATGLKTYSSHSEESDQSHAPKPPLFARKDEQTGLRDIQKVWYGAKNEDPRITRGLTAAGIGIGAHALGSTIKRAITAPSTLGKAALGTATRLVLPLAAIHFGGKLVKGIRNRREHKQIARHYENEQKEKRGIKN